MRRADAWQRDPALWPAHVAGYTHRVAVESAARKHGRALGVAFQVLLARRLRAVDVRDGILDGASAWRSVERWSREGPRARGERTAA